MRNLRIYLIIILASLVLSMFIPRILKDFVAEAPILESLYYSPVEHDFIKVINDRKNKNITYTNIDGSKNFSMDEYKQKRPFVFYYDLIKVGNFPKELAYYGKNIHQIRSNKSFLRIKPDMIKSKIVNLYPLFESNPKYTSLEQPKDLFSIGKDGVTFVKTKENTIDKDKSEIYTNKLKQLGAKFPLLEAFGTPSTAKIFDEGYFILDNNHTLFHIKQRNNKPIVKKVKMNGIKPKFLLTKEDSKKKYYGLLVSENKELYFLTYDNYKMIKLPVENFDYNNEHLRLSTTPLNAIIKIKSKDTEKKENTIKIIVMDLKYKVLKEITYKYKANEGKLYEMISSVLLPYQLNFNKTKDGNYSLVFTNLSAKSFIVYLCISLLFFVYLLVFKHPIRKNIPSIILIAFAGIYSIIALVIFNKLIVRNQIKKGNK